MGVGLASEAWETYQGPRPSQGAFNQVDFDLNDTPIPHWKVIPFESRSCIISQVFLGSREMLLLLQEAAQLWHGSELDWLISHYPLNEAKTSIIKCLDLLEPLASSSLMIHSQTAHKASLWLYYGRL